VGISSEAEFTNINKGLLSELILNVGLITISCFKINIKNNINIFMSSSKIFQKMINF